MKTYQPIWNFQNRLLYLLAAVFWLLFLVTVETRDKAYKPGHLLSLKDAREIATLLLAEKEAAF